jgi:tRNA pseudouridine55 synthase
LGVAWELGLGTWELTGVPLELTGALLVDKPSGPTSHDIVAFTRRVLKTSRVGHTGTLDPLATGLLVLLIGPATRLARFVAGDDKEYIADVRLGIATPTYDAESLSAVHSPSAASRYPLGAEVEAALGRFRGSFLQTPPAYSAKKVAGVAAYEKARKNQAVDLRPVSVTVRELEVLAVPESGQRTADGGPGGLLRLRVVASAGFYVRSLAHDLGEALGCGAHLEALRRTRAGRFRAEDAATLDVLEGAGPAAAARVIPVNTLLADLPAVVLTEEGLRRARNGNVLGPAHLEKGGCPLFRVPGAEFPGKIEGFQANRKDLHPEKVTAPFFRVLDAAGTLVAVADTLADGLLHPLVVLR